MNANRKIGVAMATAVSRANTLSYAELLERHQADQKLIADLRQQLREAKRHAFDAEQGRASSAGQTINGRPVMTLAQAARAANVQYHTARRYAEKGKWESVRQTPDNHRSGARGYSRHFVYADQSLS